MTQYYAIDGDQLLTMANSGTVPAAVVFYQADGTIVGDVVIPAGVTGYTYLLKNPKAGEQLCVFWQLPQMVRGLYRENTTKREKKYFFGFI